MKPHSALYVLIFLFLSCWGMSAQTYDTNGDFVQTFAGSGFYGYFDGVGVNTMFNGPSSIVADSQGNLFVMDSGNSRIRKIAPDSTVTTFAGGGSSALPGFGTNVSLGVAFNSLAIDQSNTLWMVGNSGNGVYSFFTIATNAYVSRTTTTNLTGLNFGSYCCFDSAHNVYYSSPGGNKIYRWFTNGTLEVFVGSGNNGAIDGNGIFTSFNSPTALACDSADNIYVMDGGARIRRVNQNRDVVTIAGLHAGAFDGNGTNTGFSGVAAMCVDNSGSVYLAAGNCIRKMDSQTNVVTLAGSFTQTGYTNDVAGKFARFNSAQGICISGGTIYVADANNQRIRSITNNPAPQVIAGANLGISTYPGITITGIVGRTYQVQSSPDSATWTTRATILLNSSPYLWIDQNPVAGNSFYRTILLP